jgi:hypothetical protein
MRVCFSNFASARVPIALQTRYQSKATHSGRQPVSLTTAL